MVLEVNNSVFDIIKDRVLRFTGQELDYCCVLVLLLFVVVFDCSLNCILASTVIAAC